MRKPVDADINWCPLDLVFAIAAMSCFEWAARPGIELEQVQQSHRPH
jgi:hypothetical protein